MTLLNIPAELRVRQQWLLAGPDKAPLSIYPPDVKTTADLIGYYERQEQSSKLRTYPASISNPLQFICFSDAFEYAYGRGLHVGYVLTADDPYSCIDFDVKDANNEPDPTKRTPLDACEWFWELAQKWDSYTELSAGGKGLHLWVRGKIGAGRRRFPVEVYSQERFIICTGKPVIQSPIRDRQEWMTHFVDRYLSPGTRGEPVPDEPARYTDEEVFGRIARSEQWPKFSDLFYGAWEKHRYPSQSEADAALLGLLFNYSRNNEQLKRIFRRSRLGWRAKATKDDRYLDRTIQSIRQRRAIDPATTAAVIAAADKVIASQKQLLQAHESASEAIRIVLDTLRRA